MFHISTCDLCQNAMVHEYDGTESDIIRGCKCTACHNFTTRILLEENIRTKTEAVIKRANYNRNL